MTVGEPGEVKLSIDDLHVAYRGTRAVRGVSLEVRHGEIVALVGPNGAGKSSTLRALAGHVKPAAGSITFDGTRIDGRRAAWIARRGIALVPEGRGVLGSLTVAENLMLGQTPIARRHRANDDLEAMLERFPILRRTFRRSAALLSGGEQQQLVIARALLGRPTLLVLDEPSLGLAPQMTETVFAILVEQRAAGATILLVEQNATQAVALADRSYVLSGGRIVAEGGADELLAEGRLAAGYFGLDDHDPTPSTSPQERAES